MCKSMSTQLQAAFSETFLSFWTCCWSIQGTLCTNVLGSVADFLVEILANWANGTDKIRVQQTHCHGPRGHEANLELCRDDPKLPSSLKRFAGTLLSGGKSWARLLVCNKSNLFFFPQWRLFSVKGLGQTVKHGDDSIVQWKHLLCHRRWRPMYTVSYLYMCVTCKIVV